MTPLPLTKEIDVLMHTSRTGRYVTDETDVIAMGNAGLLKDYGPQKLADGMHYFTLTEAGRQKLADWRATQPKPKPPTRSQGRYQEYLRNDCCFESLFHFLKYNENQRKLGHHHS